MSSSFDVLFAEQFSSAQERSVWFDEFDRKFRKAARSRARCAFPRAMRVPARDARCLRNGSGNAPPSETI